MAGLEGRPISSINESDLLELISNQVPEGKTIDYKRELPGPRESDRDEFLADLTSFANTSGGHIVYGVEDDGGIPTVVCGIGQMVPEDVKLRLEGMREAGIRPRVPGVEFHTVQLTSGGQALVVRIPKSWAAPHQTRFRFWGRNSNGKYRLDVDELRSIFNVKETITERVRAFWIDRVNRVVSGETAVPMGDGAKLMLGLLPVSSFDPTRPLTLPRRPPLDLQMTVQRGTGWGTTYNLDGLVMWGTDDSTYSWYTQVLRTGGLEFVDAWILAARDGMLNMPSTGYETTLVEALGRLLRTLVCIGAEPPAVCMLSFVGVSGYSLTASQKKFERDVLMLPPIMVEDSSGTPSALLKPLFDMVWNAFGFERSANYDHLGGWRPRS
jgi:Putative DNA-binding domain